LLLFVPERKIQKKLDELISTLKDGRLEYVPREKTSIDWASYDEAQINEMNEQLLIIRNIIDDAHARLGLDCKKCRVGRPPKSAADKAKAILLQQYFMACNRLSSGLTLLFKEKLGLSSKLRPKTIERAYENGDVVSLIKLAFDMTSEPVSTLETKFAVDGSGEPLSIKQNYANDRDDEKKHAGYKKFIGMCGVRYKLYSAIELTDGEANECPYLEPLLAKTAELYERIDLVCADAAYLSRKNCNAIRKHGATARIYPKEGITLKKKGSAEWVEMLTTLTETPQEWLEDYHNRSISETTHSTCKRRNPKPLMRRLEHRRYVEEYTRKCNYNFTRLIHIHYLNSIKNKWTTP
jgi:transposase